MHLSMDRGTNIILTLTLVLYCSLVRAIFALPHEEQLWRPNNSLPFSKYSFLASQDSYPTFEFVPYSNGGGIIIGPKPSPSSVTQQLNSGVRALILHVRHDRNYYDVRRRNSEDVHLCHSCDLEVPVGNFISYAPDLLKEVEAFLASNPSEIVTLILEDHVEAPNALTKAFDATGLTKYLLPLKKMPRYGDDEDWPSVKDMVAHDHRLIVFTSNASKEESEGIAYRGNYVVEYKHGSLGSHSWDCAKTEDSLALTNASKSLVLLNYYSRPNLYAQNVDFDTKSILNALQKCYTAASNRWANFIAVDYVLGPSGMGPDVGPVFEAVNFLNRKLLCGCEDVNSCRDGCGAISSEVEPKGQKFHIGRPNYI